MHPDRCTRRQALYKRYYTLHAPASCRRRAPTSRSCPATTCAATCSACGARPMAARAAEPQNAFIERFRYFMQVPWDTEHYYWDYQKMRREYGPGARLGHAIGLPAAPTPGAPRRATTSTIWSCTS